MCHGLALTARGGTRSFPCLLTIIFRSLGAGSTGTCGFPTPLFHVLLFGINKSLDCLLNVLPITDTVGITAAPFS